MCPSLPNNSKVTSGCAWECSLGFQEQSTADSALCLPCTGVPSSCQVSTYLGYAANSQCARCLPCTNVVPNSVYTSAGDFNGPNTCALLCNPGYFIAPQYGLDAFGNPVACVECSQPLCVSGVSYYVPCTATEDAQCAACSACPIGFDVLRLCTVGSNTTCAPCAPAPSNASWTAPGCTQWACDAGFYLLGNVCVGCKQPRDCLVSDSYGLTRPGCGVCVPCNASLLLPFQCFNGDGQCGATYWCGWTTTTTPSPTTVVTTPVATTAAEASLYATIMTLAPPDGADLGALTQQITCQLCTSVRVLSVTTGCVTTYCDPSGCGARRRALLVSSTTVDVGIVSTAPNPTVASTVAIVSVTASLRVDNASVLDDAASFSLFVNGAPGGQEDPGVAPLFAYSLLVVGCLSVAFMLFALFFRWSGPVVTESRRAEIRIEKKYLKKSG